MRLIEKETKVKNDFMFRRKESAGVWTKRSRE